jgi:L-fucose isomerase-like protein
MCLAWSRLLDEGLVGACEGDSDAAISMLLSASLLGQPGFMQDPVPNTLRNTLIGSHCTCPTRLDGFEKPHEPFILRSQAESASGVALQVLWRPGQEITIMKFQAPDALVLGTGRVVDNVEGAAATACRTAVEVKVDGLDDARNVKNDHQLFLAGKRDEPIKAFAELAGLKLAPV